MIVNIEDRTIKQILQVAIKEEIEFLARNLLRQPAIREVLWAEVSGLMRSALVDAGVAGAKMEDLTPDKIGEIEPPSGGGGGSDPGDDNRDPSSGGGGGSDPGDDNRDPSSGGGGGKDDPKPKPKPVKK